MAGLLIQDIQLRENRWVIANLRGKGGRVRTVPVPTWVRQAVNLSTGTAGIASGLAVRIGRFGAQDLRHRSAKRWRENGGDLEQIKFLLGHSSIQTTELYPGSGQRIAVAVNDNLGLLRDRKSAIPSGLYFNRHEAKDGL